MAILGSLPAVGWLFNALALAFGLGAILTHALARLREIREGVHEVDIRKTAPAYPLLPENASRVPPPMLDDGKPAPGMDNLPRGFDWWGEDR